MGINFDIKKDYSKYFWLTALILIIVAFFLARFPLNTESAPISGIFIIFLAIPCYIAVVYWLGWKKGLALIIILSIYALSIETFAIITGFPYSSFHYNEFIGYKIAGYTPYTVPFAYVPLFVGCFYLSTLISNNKIKICLLTAILVLIVDMVLDPAAVALKFWIYEDNGFFYGVPFMNFAGWILTGFIASIISIFVVGENFNDPQHPTALVSSLFLILSFWSAVCLYLGLHIPAIIGFLLILLILYKTKLKMGLFS